MNIYKRHRFPSEVIQHAVWLYHRFNLSFRDIEDLLHERAIDVSYEAIRLWCNKFGPEYAKRLKKKRVDSEIYSTLMKSSLRLMASNITFGVPLTRMVTWLMCIFRSVVTVILPNDSSNDYWKQIMVSPGRSWLTRWVVIQLHTRNWCLMLFMTHLSMPTIKQSCLINQREYESESWGTSNLLSRDNDSWVLMPRCITYSIWADIASQQRITKCWEVGQLRLGGM